MLSQVFCEECEDVLIIVAFEQIIKIDFCYCSNSSVTIGYRNNIQQTFHLKFRIINFIQFYASSQQTCFKVFLLMELKISNT